MIIKINPNDIPPGTTGRHIVRFRVVSVDQNRTSHWVYKEVSGIHEPVVSAGGIARFAFPPSNQNTP